MEIALPGVDYVVDFVNFTKEAREYGFWYAFTGKSLTEWLGDKAHAFGVFIYEKADYTLLILLAFTLFAMCGSKRSVKYLYWTFLIYIGVKAVGSALL